MSRRTKNRYLEHIQNKQGLPTTANKGGQILVQQVKGQMSWQTHMLPVPVMREYETLIPGFAKDVHGEWKKEVRHRRSLDSWLVKGGTTLAFTGQLCALLIVLAILSVAAYALFLGYPTVAAVIVGIDLVGIVAAFLGRSYIGRNDTLEDYGDEYEEDAEDDAETEDEAEPEVVAQGPEQTG